MIPTNNARFRFTFLVLNIVMDHSERTLCINIFTVDLVFLYGIMLSTFGLRLARVLSRIYCLGERSRVAEGIELPGGVPGQAAPEII